MKQLNEVARMQQIAGLKENFEEQIFEENEDFNEMGIFDDIQDDLHELGKEDKIGYLVDLIKYCQQELEKTQNSDDEFEDDEFEDEEY
jgi:hypothetical protein